ncbi:hypothetical protein [Burkholderia multivorans]|nr:hypothetical protein [Burkholderia multivorans]
MADPLGLDAARGRATSGGYAAPDSDAGAVRETGHFDDVRCSLDR